MRVNMKQVLDPVPYALQFRSDRVDSARGLTLQVGQLHRESHVPLDLDLALEERLLRVQLPGDQVHDVLVADGEGHVRFISAVVSHFTFALFRVDHPVTFRAVWTTLHFKAVYTADFLDEVLLIGFHRLLQDLHVFVDFEVFGGARDGGHIVRVHVSESFAIHTDDDGTSQSKIVLKSYSRARDLRVDDRLMLLLL